MAQPNASSDKSSTWGASSWGSTAEAWGGVSMPTNSGWSVSNSLDKSSPVSSIMVSSAKNTPTNFPPSSISNGTERSSSLPPPMPGSGGSRSVAETVSVSPDTDPALFRKPDGSHSSPPFQQQSIGWGMVGSNPPQHIHPDNEDIFSSPKKVQDEPSLLQGVPSWGQTSDAGPLSFASGTKTSLMSSSTRMDSSSGIGQPNVPSSKPIGSTTSVRTAAIVAGTKVANAEQDQSLHDTKNNNENNSQANQALLLQQQIAFAQMQQMQAQVQLQQMQMAGYPVDAEHIARMQALSMAMNNMSTGMPGVVNSMNGMSIGGNTPSQGPMGNPAMHPHAMGQGGHQGYLNNGGPQSANLSSSRRSNMVHDRHQPFKGPRRGNHHRGDKRYATNERNSGWHGGDVGANGRHYDRRGERRPGHSDRGERSQRGGRGRRGRGRDPAGRRRGDRHDGHHSGRGVQGRSLSPHNSTSLGPVKLSEIQGRSTVLALHQSGCRLLQHAVNTLGDEAIAMIIEEHSNDALRKLMIDPFGNYLFQKLVDGSDAERLSHILDACAMNPKVTPSSKIDGSKDTETNWIVSAALNTHGTRSVQSLVRRCTRDPERQRLIKMLSPSVEAMSVSTNGNHVIQRCLQIMSPHDLEFVYGSIIKRLLSISTQRHGCCVVQRCIDAAPREAREAIFNKVVEPALVYELMQDQYGNYVVQYCIDRAGNDFLAELTDRIEGSIAVLSRQKFSSNVIEKCLHRADRRTRGRLIQEIITPGAMDQMLYDQYANYVVQRAMSVADQEQARLLADAIVPHIDDLKTTAIGRRILSRVFRRFPELDRGSPAQNDKSAAMQANSSGRGVYGAQFQLAGVHSVMPD